MCSKEITKCHVPTDLAMAKLKAVKLKSALTRFSIVERVITPAGNAYSPHNS